MSINLWPWSFAFTMSHAMYDINSGYLFSEVQLDFRPITCPMVLVVPQCIVIV